MEFVHGRTLAAWLKDERPGWRKILTLIKQAGQGIAAAHAEGLLHRDIKPDNITVTLNTARARHDLETRVNLPAAAGLDRVRGLARP